MQLFEPSLHCLNANQVYLMLDSEVEWALLDVREEGAFDTGHPFWAVNVPLSHIESRIAGLVPRLGTPLVVLDDADLEKAVGAALIGRFMHQGQICMSTERIIVVDPLTGEKITELEELVVFPATHYAASDERMRTAMTRIEAELQQQLAKFEGENKLLEAQRLITSHTN